MIFAWILVVFFAVTAMVENVLASDTSRVILASEVLDKIRGGMPVYYDNVIIGGNLNVSNLNGQILLASNFPRLKKSWLTEVGSYAP